MKAELETLSHQGRRSGEDVKAGAEAAQGGFDGLTASMVKANLASEAMAFGKQMLTSMAQGAVEAGQELRKMAEDFIGLRDRARELAGIMGGKATSAFTTEQLQFAAATGMTGDDALKFRAAFQGEAQQYKGRFAEGQFGEFEKTAAQYAQQMGLGANEAAKLAGNVIRSGPKEGATAGDLTKTLGQAFAIVQGGSGDNPILAKQLAETNASMVGDSGPFRNIQDAAVGVRMMAEANQSEAFTTLQAMQRGLTGLAAGKGKGDKAGMGEKLGVGFDTSLLEGVAKLDEAQAASGVGMEQFLTSIFANQHERQGFAVAIKARRGGVEGAARSDAEKVKAGDVEAGVKNYLEDPDQPGALNVSRARTALKEAELSQDKVKIAALLQDATTEITERKTKAGVKGVNKVLDYTPFGWAKNAAGYKDSEEALQYEEAQTLGEKRAKAAGVDMSQEPAPAMGLTGIVERTVLERHLARLVELTEAAQKKALVIKPGGDPATR